MCHRRFFPSTLSRITSILSAVLVFGVVGFVLVPGSRGEGGEAPPVQDSPDAGRAMGPAITDFNTEGFKISKVVRIERALNALGIAGQFGKTNKVGKYVELPKRLEPSERGEHFIVSWKCSPKRGTAPAPEKAVVRLDYKLSNEEHLETITKEYLAPKKGTYRLLVDNTGNSYRRRGRIEYWRVRIFADDTLVARKESFLWAVFRGGEKTATSEGG